MNPRHLQIDEVSYLHINPVRIEGEFYVVELSGELDGHTAEQLRDILSELHKRAPIGFGVIVDMIEVDFMDSVGLGVLIQGLVEFTGIASADRPALPPELSAPFVLVGLQPIVQRAITVTGVAAIMPVYADVEEVLNNNGLQVVETTDLAVMRE
ncbi:MAG: STAS domain-containing protein [Patescibacteria group bacterium]|jgi:anti-anti-sigma factor